MPPSLAARLLANVIAPARFETLQAAPLPRSFIGRDWTVGRAVRALGDGTAVTRRGGR